MSEVVLAIDIGTSSLRAQLFDTQAEPCGPVCARPQVLRTDGQGAAEIDADHMVEQVAACLEAVGEGLDGRRPIGVGLATFWHSAVGVSAAGDAVTPILTWADTRSQAQVRYLRERVDIQDLHYRTGCVLHTSYLPARLLWAREAHPEWRVHRWLSPGEYVMSRLAGTSACSLSMASATGLFDSRAKCWDPVLMDLCRIEPGQLPVVSAALLTEPAHGRVAWLSGVPWMAPLGDGACSNVGSGAIGVGETAIMLGTSGAVRRLGPWPHEDWSVPHGLWRYALDEAHVLYGGALSNGGSVWAWLQRLLRVEGELPAEPEPDVHGLTVLPFLAGERSPGWRGDARATIHGIGLNTSSLDILQAGMEAVTYRLALVRDLLQDTVAGRGRIIATGGAFVQSPTWLQMLADVLGEDVTVSAEAEASSRGVVLMTLQALGRIPSFSALRAPLAMLYRPRADRHAKYQVARARQQQLYDLMWGLPNRSAVDTIE